ncbi:MAG TPA: hypothetical protein VGT99_14040 [Gammaproteobacteria bacterium]|nr:hypothetical protein [Gammaproteobacteria bacterium]
MNAKDELRQRIASLEARVGALERALGESSVVERTSGDRKKPAAREFLMSKNLKSEVQKVLALGYFLEHIAGMECFNIKDIEKAFHSAREKPPKNMNDAVNKNIARGFIMEAPDKKESMKAWYLTSTGESYLEGELNR